QQGQTPFSKRSESAKKWVKEFDDNSNSFYYVNTMTNTSQWEKPTSLPPTARTGLTPQASSNAQTSITPYSISASADVHQQKVAIKNSASEWESAIDEITGERFYIHKVTGESQWEKPENFIEPTSLFMELKSLDAPMTAATQMKRQNMTTKKADVGVEEGMAVFSTAVSQDEIKKLNDRKVKADSESEDAAAAGMYKDGALSYIIRQKRAAEMLQKYVRGRKARRELRRRMKEKDSWVKENAKKTGAYDDIFDRLRGRGAKIRAIDNWEQWLDSSGRIFYYNPMDARGQWVPPLNFEKRMAIEEVERLDGRNKALQEDAAMRKLERNWENRTDVEAKWNKLELVQRDKMQASWNGNSWIRGLDSLRAGADFTRDALEMEKYVGLYGNLKQAEKGLDNIFDTAESAIAQRMVRGEGKIYEENDEEGLSSDGDEMDLESAAEKDSKTRAKKRERFIKTVSRGAQDVLNPEMLRRAFILRRGKGKNPLWCQLADPLTGFKFYKNKADYTFQWEKPKSWDEVPEDGEGEGGAKDVAARKKNKKSGKNGGGEDDFFEKASTPQKIVISIIGRDTKQQHKRLARTRLKLSHYEPSEGEFGENYLGLSASPSRGEAGCSNNMGAQTTLANLLTRASQSGPTSMRYNRLNSSSEEGWLRETVMDMYLDTQKAIGKDKNAKQQVKRLPPTGADKKKTMRFMESRGGAGGGIGGGFAMCKKELGKMSEMWPDEVRERRDLYSDSIWHAVRYFEALPTINTPRQRLKNRRRTGNVGNGGQGGKGGAGRGAGKQLPNSELLFFSHPKIHELDEAIKGIVAFAKSQMSQDRLTDWEADSLLSSRRTSNLAKAQYYSPASTAHQLNQATDRLLSYALPGKSSMVRSDTALGSGVRCTQRLVQLRDSGVGVVEVSFGDSVREHEDWCILMTTRGALNGKALPPLNFKPSSVPGALNERYYRAKKAENKGPIVPPLPKSKPPEVDSKEIYYLNKRIFTCQPGMPFELTMGQLNEEADEEGRGGAADEVQREKKKKKASWKPTNRVARVGFYGEGVKDFDQFLNLETGVVMYRETQCGERDGDTNTDEEEEGVREERERKENALLQIDAEARIVFDKHLENGLKSIFMSLNELKKGKDCVGIGLEVASLCKNRQFLHASKNLRLVSEILEIGIETENEFDGSKSSMEAPSEMLVSAAAAISLQGWWRGCRTRRDLRGEELARTLKGAEGVIVSPDVSVGGSKIWRIRAKGAGKENGGAAGEVIKDIQKEGGGAEQGGGEEQEDKARVQLRPEIEQIVDAAFAHVANGKDTVPELTVIVTLNTLHSDGGLKEKEKAGEGGSPLAALAGILPREGEGMDEIIRLCDGAGRLDKFLFRELFAHTNVVARRSARNGDLAVDVDIPPAGTQGNTRGPTHVDYALSGRVCIARGWALAAAGDIVGASRAAGTATKHLTRGSKLAGQTACDVEGLVKLAELLGGGIGDWESQCKLLEGCMRRHPSHPLVMRSGGRMLVDVTKAVGDLPHGFSQQAARFLSKCASEADRKAQTPGGKELYALERAECLYNLAEFELCHSRQVPTEGKDYEVPLVSVERKFRQALSIISVVTEKRGMVEAEAKVLCSRLNYSLGRVMHVYKGGLGGGQREAFNREEALRFYEKAKWWGERSLPGKSFSREGYEGCLAIGIHSACLLSNMGRVKEADLRFRSVLFKHQHEVGAGDGGAWMVYGAFLENVRGDLGGASMAYERGARVGKETGWEGKGYVALSQLFELQRGESERGLNYLQKAMNGAKSEGEVDGGKEGLLVMAAQFCSEVDGDVVTATQILDRVLEAKKGYGPALRWQGLLLARGGRAGDGIKKLRECCKWRGGGGKIYGAGYSCLAMMGLAHGVGAGEDVWEKTAKNVERAKGLLGRVLASEPWCRWTNLMAALVQLCYYGDAEKAKGYLEVCVRENGGGRAGLGNGVSECLGEEIPAEAMRVLARLHDLQGRRVAAVGTWKRLLVWHPGDRLGLAGLGMTLWGALRDGGRDFGEGELSALGEERLRDWKEEIREECTALFRASVGEEGGGKWGTGSGGVVPECHAMFAAFLQDEMEDDEAAMAQLGRAAKGWKVAQEGREEELGRGGEVASSTNDVPSTVLYRMGRSSESRGDLAAAEKFYTWAVEVDIKDAWGMENLGCVVRWAERDRKRARERYKVCMRRRRKWADAGGGGGALGEEDKEYELRIEEEVAFSARCYMLHSRLAVLAGLREQEVRGDADMGFEEAGISTETIEVVERGWEERSLGRVGGRDSWQQFAR
ncbi:hypothetical protein TrRE_jg5636, partial [Triparma retinervis]